jgi:DNA-damage-inducible protein J
MIAKNTVVRARVNDHLKHDVDGILSNLGLTMSDAINALFCQIKLRNGLPFEVHVPNRATAKVIKDSAKGKNITKFDSIDDLFDDLTN